MIFRTIFNRFPRVVAIPMYGAIIVAVLWLRMHGHADQGSIQQPAAQAPPPATAPATAGQVQGQQPATPVTPPPAAPTAP